MPHRERSALSSRTERAAYDAPTGLLLITHPNGNAIGTPDQLEVMAHFIMRAVTRQRLKQHREAWPTHQLDQIADV